MISIVVVFCTVQSNFSQKMGIFVFANVMAAAYIVGFRPYQGRKFNIAEALQEFVYLFIVAEHIVWNTEEKWNDLKVMITLNVLMINGFIVTFIMAIPDVIRLVSSIYRTFFKTKYPRREHINFDTGRVSMVDRSQMELEQSARTNTILRQMSNR